MRSICCVNTVAKRMQEAGIAAKTTRKFRCTTTNSDHDLPVAEILLDRHFDWRIWWPKIRAYRFTMWRK